MREHKIEHITVGDIATNCWIYPLSESRTAGEGRKPPRGFRNCAVIDPGDEAERIIARLKELKLVLKYILLTHGHFDHIAALPALAAAWPEAVIAIHRDDGEYLGPGSYSVHVRSFSAAGGTAAYIDSLWEDMPPPDTTLEEGGTIGPFTVLHLPGHTRGSAGFWDKEAKVLFSGDTLFRGDYGRTDLPGGDETQLFTSLRRLFSMDGEIMVLPGHGPVTAIGEEARRFKG
ncbi:MAG: MBL fold metallo-hydrolase [Treponema sp.]|jgi:glyoxylase-like metal-dependent hydrolase (beta-lactamase superfamily II)|nr:MBL fold metallo-hydrolase [Treponema sp.]